MAEDRPSSTRPRAKRLVALRHDRSSSRDKSVRGPHRSCEDDRNEHQQQGESRHSANPNSGVFAHPWRGQHATFDPPDPSGPCTRNSTSGGTTGSRPGINSSAAPREVPITDHGRGARVGLRRMAESAVHGESWAGRQGPVSPVREGEWPSWLPRADSAVPLVDTPWPRLWEGRRPRRQGFAQRLVSGLRDPGRDPWRGRGGTSEQESQ
jgi:hypothetical protein